MRDGPVSPPVSPAGLRPVIAGQTLADEKATLDALIALAGLGADDRAAIARDAARLVRAVRGNTRPGMMESFLAEYGLTTKEGVALMCLAEALLRVPDRWTMDELIEDKVAPADWSRHLGHSSSPLVNASTWALMLTGRVVGERDEDDLAGALHGMVKRLGEPVIRTAVRRAMQELGRQFVLGRTIDEAAERAKGMEAKGYTYSYDMLGEAARTEADARRYHIAYSQAISAIAAHCDHDDIRANPGISVKLSALHPRYEYGQKPHVLDDIAARTRSLALIAKSAGMGFNIDAEEADRLDISLDVIEAVLSDRALAGWDGFGVVVQAYGKRARHVLEWLHALATRLDRRIMVRLVKGAYWDSEIKRAQVMGLDGFPVFTRKVSTDLSYIACARLLLGMTDRIYPQFATHNAHTVAAVLRMAGGVEGYEFQRLHGMGESLHEAVRKESGVRCRIYAPVGAHRDLLAYLVRRLLENGANSSFVNQIVDERVTPEEIARDPLATVEGLGDKVVNDRIPRPAAIYGADRRGARGWDLTDPVTVAELDAAREPFRTRQWSAAPMIAVAVDAETTAHPVRNPATGEPVGTVADGTAAHAAAAIGAAAAVQPAWAARPAGERAACLERVADLYEEHAPELFALACREAGKTLPDGVAEVREAVDFCRYYAAEARRAGDGARPPCGVFACVSPWNFPLAIFTGQIAAALVTGNAVVAKPAEQSVLIAARAVELMREAGVPEAVIQLVPGPGETVGAALTGDPRIGGVCFTGSTDTARHIHRALAAGAGADAPLIAETGGLNAMIVDSTALPEQAVRDIVASAFQSAGQRCSALRVLYVQKDVEGRILEMLYGAMDALRVGDPWDLATDVGPVIDAEARRDIDAHCTALEADGRLLRRVGLGKETAQGSFVAPTVLKIDGIAALEREIFGPVLHVATYEATDLERVLEAINATGYGLTLGLHTRVDSRVQQVVDAARVGNLYVNRNQIGAVVGSQPFGGEGLSGTGPKAGGPHYLDRFRRPLDGAATGTASKPAPAVDPAALDRALAVAVAGDWATRGDRMRVLRRVAQGLDGWAAAVAEASLATAEAIDMAPVDLPGPTGESNRLSLHPRGTLLCLGDLGDDRPDAALGQAMLALALGNGAVVAAPGAVAAVSSLRAAGVPVAELDGRVPADLLRGCRPVDAVLAEGPPAALAEVRRALAARDGALVSLVVGHLEPHRCLVERALCIDTTAAGGNAQLLVAAAE
ncbi:MAG: bifunctional proline dehydrogenase/L-glutamate gamma-semialdehyde dehydrogenase PutA [Thalassobaculum sp.]|uniref:bifunctional proline dehydrogenase/L-glutamate gamma-semialdehyde dehydrogenase PutA n=1 Tax=Thalassobaculum sp. TaxID=2022740 RepID=UPI0032EB52BE